MLRKLNGAPVALALALLLAGCATGPSVRVSSDPETSFTAYRTFGFAEPLGTDRNGYRSQVSAALLASTRRQLEARGLVYSADKPELLVNFNAALAQKMRVSSTPEPMMGVGYGVGYYGYRTGLYAPYPVYQDRTTVTEYQEGTLNIDVADAALKRLVWEGVVTQSLDDKAYQNLGPVIETAVTKAFDRFPLKPKK